MGYVCAIEGLLRVRLLEGQRDRGEEHSHRVDVLEPIKFWKVCRLISCLSPSHFEAWALTPCVIEVIEATNLAVPTLASYHFIDDNHRDMILCLAMPLSEP